MYFIVLLVDNPKVSIHPSRIRRRFCDKRNVYWLPWNVLPKGDVAEHREVEWKSEKGETIGIRSKTKKHPKDHFAASMTVSFLP